MKKAVAGYLEGGRRRNTTPLNPAAMLARRIILWPQYVDECGCTVPPEIMKSAASRNLSVVFGPELRQWRLKRVGQREVILQPWAADAAEPLPTLPGACALPSAGEEASAACAWEERGSDELPQGRSLDDSKSDLRCVVSGLCMRSQGGQSARAAAGGGSRVWRPGFVYGGGRRGV